MVSVDRCILNKDTRLVEPERLVDTTYQENIVAGRTIFCRRIITGTSVIHFPKDSGLRHLPIHYNDPSASP